MNTVRAPVTPQSWSTAAWSTASKSISSRYSSNINWSWPWSTSPNTFVYGLQVCMVMASPSASTIMLDHGLQVCTIMASKWISKLASLWPPSASRSSLALSHRVLLQTHSIAASKCILWVHWLLASKCISKLAQLRPPTISLSAQDDGVVKWQRSHGNGRDCVSNSVSASRSMGRG